MKKFFLYISLISCFTYAQIPSNIPTDGLYGYWPLDGNVNDLSSNENHGTTDGNYSLDTHENGEQSVYLQNQMIVLPSSNDLNVDNFTVQFWTKAVSYNIHNKVQFGEINSNSRWVLNWADSISPLWNSSLLYYWPSACTTYADFNNSVFETSIDRDVWHLLTFVVEGQSTSFYRNGDLITTLSGASNLTCFNDNMNIYFGGDIGGGAIEYYNGWFDNIAIWTRALNSEEIESIHYSSTSGCDYQGNFLDQDGNQNQYINYGDLDWNVSEVSVTTYRDGTPIPLIVDESEWGSQSTGAYCYVNNDPNNNILYNYYAIIGKHDNDPNTPNKNLAPEGWRMPSDADWNNLTEFISNTDYVSDGNIAMAMASTSGWTNSSNSGAPGFMQSENNSSCFNAHPNGTRGVGAGFNQQGETSEFWSTDELTHYINFAINTFINTNNNPGNGKSARFVRDFEDNCTSDGTFIDQENNVYDYINYGTQSWSVLNAATEIYRDGTPIPQITNLSDLINLTTGAWTYFENDPTKGKLYNWYAVAGIHDNDPTTPNKQFAPEGWRVPNKEDWIILQNYLVDNGFNYDNSLAGNKIAKAMASKSGWIISENIGDAGNQQNSNNSSCFNAIPYGMVSDSYNFINEGSSAIFWTSENLNSSSSYYRDINSNDSSLGAGSDFNPPNGLTIASNRGCSVRLVKDLGCTTSTPTGDVEQTFCDTAIVADLTATGDSIQWYDAATGGNLLESTTTLTDGQLVYASQTVDGCESTDRLEVTVSIQDITITASATEVCAGGRVDLTVSSGLTAGSAVCTSSDLPTNLQNGLVGYWPFCGNANDESGNGNNGTVNGATLTTDRFGNPDSAYRFDSVDDYLTIDSNNNQLDLYGNCCITISGWINIENTNNQYGIFTNSGFNVIHQQYALKVDANNKLYFLSGNGLFEANGINYSTSHIELNQWTHTAVTYDGSTLKLYLNGNLEFENQVVDYFPESPSEKVFIGNSWGANNELFPGDIDDLAIWNRALTTSEIQQLTSSSTYTWSTGDITENITINPTETTEYWVDVTTNGVTCREYITINVTALAAPTGDTEQTFCNAATIADLTAEGDNIQWYDALTGGNLLDSSAILTDGQMVYASQTVNGCESTDRLEVKVSIQDITITASATEVCAGESVDLSVAGDSNSTYLWSTGESNFSGQGTLVDEYSLIANTVSQNTFSTIPGNTYRLEVSGAISLGGGAGNKRDVAYYTQSGPDGTTEGTPFDSACNLRIWTSLFCDTPGLRPSPDIYDASTHTYNYPFTANSSTLDVGFWDSPLGDNAPNMVTFKLYELSNSESTITVTPIETTEYWVDVTTNGVTCREYITINVTAPAAPTGSSVQGGCSDFTVGSNNNTFTGENLQWYAAPSGGTALPDSHLLADGTYYYISQTIDGCESSDRFEFLYLAPDPIITIDTPIICEGDSTTVSITSSPSFGTATFLWNTGETSESINLSPTESTTFWVDQIYNSGGPENIQTVCRYFFGITVDNAPEAPVSGGDISECETVAAQTLIAIASAEAGESITWYDTPTGGSVVADPSLSAAGTVTYYAEATNDSSGCVSLSRTALTLTITSVSAPIGDGFQSFCDNVSVSDLSISGSNIQWYDAATGGNILDPSSALSDGQLLYASQTQNGCESITRLEVGVEIDIIPDPILITTELEFCLAREATLADLEFDDQAFALEWYDSFNGGNMLSMDTLLEDDVSYYATLYDALSGCESLMRLEVVPTVIPCEVIIYNALSLNDNGQNDYMVIENAEYFPDNNLEVYNRDGHLVYSQTQYGLDDNLFRGIANVGNIYGNGSVYSLSSHNLPTGSYLYIFKYFNPYEQQQYTLKGFLTINSN